MNTDRELLEKAAQLLKKVPKATRSMYVGKDRVPYGVQAEELAKEIAAAIALKEGGGE